MTHGFRRTLARLLTSRFPSIVIGEAGDGGEAMEKVENFLPNLIFMDIYIAGAERIGAYEKNQNALSKHSYRYAYKL